MENIIRDYLRVIQTIALCKGDDELGFTPYGFDSKRGELHNKLFQEIMPSLHLVEGFTEDDAYWRSKQIFSNLDKIFSLYNDLELDLKDTEHIMILNKDLYKFLGKTEVKMFLEGRINGITGVINHD